MSIKETINIQEARAYLSAIAFKIAMGEDVVAADARREIKNFEFDRNFFRLGGHAPTVKRLCGSGLNAAIEAGHRRRAEDEAWKERKVAEAAQIAALSPEDINYIRAEYAAAHNKRTNARARQRVYDRTGISFKHIHEMGAV